LNGFSCYATSTKRRARSHERYCEIARKNIIPLIGAVILSKLQPVQISEAYAKALANGRTDGKGGLSPRTVHHMHRILKQTLKQALRWRLLARNPTDDIEPSKVERRILATYDFSQTVTLLNTMQNTRMFIPILLAVLCGLRRGEIAALRWLNVNLTTATLAVVESAEQTTAGIRTQERPSAECRPVRHRHPRIEIMASQTSPRVA
jgi:integrase